MKTSPARLSASVVIASKNRRDELRIAVRSALTQRDLLEVLVIDDGSSDGTAEMITSDCAGVRYIRHEQSQGYIARRNEGAREAKGDVVISIDDDAMFSTPEIVAQTLARFDRDEIGAVAIPYADVNQSPVIRQLAPDSTSTFVIPAFIGTAHAIRRDVFLRLDGYREHLVHQGEESDFCIRMLADGYVVRLGNGDPIHHFESPKRSFQRMDHYGPRNAILFVWQNVPFPAVVLHMPATVWHVLVLTFSPSRFLTRLGGVVSAIASFARVVRVPVSGRTYALWRRMGTAAPLSLQEVASDLGTMAS